MRRKRKRRRKRVEDLPDDVRRWRKIAHERSKDIIRPRSQTFRNRKRTWKNDNFGNSV